MIPALAPLRSSHGVPASTSKIGNHPPTASDIVRAAVTRASA
jgi:hypothetical protein